MTSTNASPARLRAALTAVPLAAADILAAAAPAQAARVRGSGGPPRPRPRRSPPRPPW
ncbi:hypothetical protein N8J89_19665 [Crossiella sp. CA-258035]|uniref:hypothetical protein n=1 Tax=Crossiella sp. CA-258035 TaxID=2981138 RepID=UPI0024BD067B|nr:hypothetical protein [Crossiella sp. CA-258035]WHT23206.1 hypothetical protein N8J89_19665 [Crossiella sp. CA-258035]